LNYLNTVNAIYVTYALDATVNYATCAAFVVA